MKKNSSSARSAAAKRPSAAFLADAMLGSLARKLRIFGFDTEYLAGTDDDKVLARGIEQGRIILTADRELYKRMVKRGARGVLVEGAGDLEDMAHVLSKLGLGLDDAKMGSRCAACNGLLEEVARKDARGVPAGVLERWSQFFRCTVCGKVYWEGGHMEKMSAFAKELRARLAKG
ncbi:Mut7-C RNAse domain-containing protein [Nitrososphaera sp.]|uniref:Mut7-C RNAse domain-containing protein n=1 Tax=Nitrososphaera sp. TaxID=1971748 RepID=UPI003180BA94